MNTQESMGLRIKGLRESKKMSQSELAEKVGITPANLSILKTNKAKAIRFSTLEKICEILDCKPGDILDYEKGAEK